MRSVQLKGHEERCAARSVRRRRRHRLQLLDHAGFDKNARLVARIGTLNTREKASRLRCARRPVRVCLFGLHAATASRCAAVLRVALDQRDKAVVR